MHFSDFTSKTVVFRKRGPIVDVDLWNGDFTDDKGAVIPVMRSKRGRPILILEGSKFRGDQKLADGRIRWRCSKRNCKSRLYTYGPSVDGPSHHNHETPRSQC
uniref:Methylenetetrahydrofolate--tRNA-(Uracil-5-)-methyltransferase TrmFO n=1 Tax=Lygus hesperus TaxID=30085 RepID=A0A0A9XDK8_LYGHE